MGTAQRATHVVGDLLRRGVWIRKPGAPPSTVTFASAREPNRCAGRSPRHCVRSLPRCRREIRRRVRRSRQPRIAGTRSVAPKARRRAGVFGRHGGLRRQSQRVRSAVARPREACGARQSRSRRAGKFRHRVLQRRRACGHRMDANGTGRRLPRVAQHACRTNCVFPVS